MANHIKKIISANLVLVLLIFFIGLFLRIAYLDKYPVGFSSEEALLGWRAKSIIEIGKDETGRKYPLIFSSINGYQLPLSTYVVALSIKLFGLSEFSVRFPYAFFSFLSLIPFYFFAKSLIPNSKSFALISLLVLTISPWGIWFSRTASSAGLAFSFFIAGFSLLLIKNQSKIIPMIAFILLLFSLLSSKISWIVIIPLLITLSIYQKSKKIFLMLVLLLFFSLPFIFQYFNSPQVKTDLLSYDFNLFSDISIGNSINMMRGEDIQEKHALLGKLFYNKTFYLEKILENFLRHFNPRFYFSSGNENSIYGLNYFGPIFLIFLPFFLYGFYTLIKDKFQFNKLFIFWFLIGILPSVVYFISPSQERTIFIFPVIAMVIAYGFLKIKIKYLLIILCLLSVNFAIVFYDSLFNEPVRTSEKYQYGYKEMVQILKNRVGNYSEVKISDSYNADPAPLILFYLNYFPEKFTNENKIKYQYRSQISQINNIQINNKNTWKYKKNILFVLTPKDKEAEKKFGYPSEDILNFTSVNNIKNEDLFLFLERRVDEKEI